MASPIYDALFALHIGSESVFLHLSNDETLTYSDFLDAAARFAAALHSKGLVPGDRLAVQVEKSPQALAVYAACTQLGVVFLPLNTAYTAAEVEYFLSNSGARVLLCDAGRASALSEIAARHDADLMTLNADGTGSLTELALGLPPRWEVAARAEDDLAALLYTSGTTGRSKGAMLSHRNLLSNAKVLTDFWRFTDEDILLHALPIFHTHGLFVATNITLLAGGSMIFLPKFDIDAMIAGMPKATSMMGVPTFYTRLLADPRFTRDLASHVRLFVSGSAPLPAETHRIF